VIGEVAGLLIGGGSFILDENFTSPAIFPRGGTFSLYIYLIFPTHCWQPFLIPNITAKYFPKEGNSPSTFPSFSPHSPYSQLANILHFKHNGKIFPTEGKFLKENVPPEGNFPSSQLATLSNSNMVPEGGHVSWEVEG